MQNNTDNQKPPVKEAFLLFSAIVLECFMLSYILELAARSIQDVGFQLIVSLIVFSSIIPIVLATLYVFDWINIEGEGGKLKAILTISFFLDLIIGELVAILFIAYRFLAYYQNEMLIIPIVFIALAMYAVAERTTETFFGVEIKIVNPFKNLRGRK